MTAMVPGPTSWHCPAQAPEFTAAKGSIGWGPNSEKPSKPTWRRFALRLPHLQRHLY